MWKLIAKRTIYKSEMREAVIIILYFPSGSRARDKCKGFSVVARNLLNLYVKFLLIPS